MTDPSPEELIQPTAFRPTEAPQHKRRLPLTPWQAAGLVALALVAVFMWFIFTAKSVRFDFDPAVASADISEGLVIELGETFLLRKGEYRITASAPGYQDLDEIVVVGEPRNQLFALVLEKLPGIVTFESEPNGAAITIDGDSIGTTPLEVPVRAGQRSVVLSLDRYQEKIFQLDVAGMEQRQTVLEALRPNWADVTIPTTPPGASVAIDDQVDATVTTPGPVQILAGEHRITVKLAGYKAWNDILRVEAEQQLTLPPIQLDRADGLVYVASSPRGAGITVDGQFLGTTPAELKLEPNRSHNVRVFKVGFDPQSRRVSVTSGQEQSLQFNLVALTGELAIATQPEGVELWIDGKLAGLTNRTVELSALPHEIELRKDGYAGYRRTITPQPGFTQEIKVKLLTLEEARLARLKPTFTTGAGQEMVLLSPSNITLGASRREPGRRANEVLREVELSRLFYLGRTEVTNAEFRQFASGHTSGAFEEHDLDGDDQPVTGISWQEAALYCNWLSRKDGLRPFYKVEFGKVIGFDASALGYRMPTEAEWAWAARTQPGTDELLRFPWGDAARPLDRHGNYADRAASNVVGRIIFGYNDNYIVSAPVKTFPPSERGLYDMGGNVAEWVHDFYEIPEPGQALNPLGPHDGDYHVIKGSSWMHGTVTELRLSFRDYGTEGRNDVGFRLARFAE